MDRVLRAAVCLAVVLAGCGGLPAGGADDPGRTVNPQLEETPTRTLSPTATPEYPPGISSAGVDIYTLSRTHRRAVAATPATVAYSVRIVSRNGTVLSDRRARVTTNGTYQIVNVSSETVPPVSDRPLSMGYSYWTNGSVTVLRDRLNGTVNYARLNGTPPTTLDPGRTGSDTVALALASYKVAFAGTVVRNGTTLYLLTADEARQSAPELRNVSLRMLVTPDGIVRAFRARHVTTVEGEPVTVTRRFRITDLGTATVTRPSWVNRTRTTTETE